MTKGPAPGAAEPARFRRLMDLVGDALDVDPAERPAFLAERCTDDPELLAEAEALLADASGGALEDLTTELEVRVQRAAARALDAAPVARLGERVGAYRLVEEIGHGGMGTVYLAERADEQYRSRVAVKFMRGRLAARDLEPRFRAERQILADLSHAHIARLLDGGTAPDGTPYFVMEYIEGEALDEWCDANALPVRARLELFLKVCDAVAYAHRSGVIHRDLKPSNILVTGDGMPKLVDFGIAKLIDAGGPELTGTLPVMTPTYASPEQVRGAALSVATDVYSLAVVLYELLAGCPPYDLTGASPARIERLICHARPGPPSAAAVGRTAAWRRELLGPLDDIVLTALDKDPARRPRSVDQLAEELRRYLRHPPRGAIATLGYRARALARRPGARAAAGALVVLTAVAGVIARERAAQHVPPLGAFEFIALPAAASPVPAPYRVHAGDFNGDGRADVLWNHLGPAANVTRIALGNADGTFSFRPAAEVPHRPARPWHEGYQLLIGDFTGAGRDDLAWYANIDSSNHIHVALSAGDGSLRFPGPPQVLSRRHLWTGSWTALVADADADGRDDLVFSRLRLINAIHVVRSRGDGSFGWSYSAEHLARWWDRYTPYVGDVDGDGGADLIWNDVPAGMNRTYVATSIQPLELLAWQDHPLAVPEYLPPERSRWAGFRTHVGDVNGDGRTDMVWIATGPDSLRIDRALGQASAQFRFLGAQVLPRPPSAGSLATATGDFNGDRRTDLLLYEVEGARGAFWIALGTPSGDFVLHRGGDRPAPPAFTGDGAGIVVADFTGDGRSDILWPGPGAVMARARPPERRDRAP